MDDAELDLLLRNERYPRSAGYSARWMVDGAMGPNPVWQAEALTGLMPLEPGMRILDMGCGTALSSIFLAKEFGVEVWATDLWVKPDENLRRAAEAHVEDQVHPIYAEAHALPFAEDFFDALISPITPRGLLEMGLLRLAQPHLVAAALGEDRPGHRRGR